MLPNTRNSTDNSPRLTSEKGINLDEVVSEPFTVQSVFEFQGPMGMAV